MCVCGCVSGWLPEVSTVCVAVLASRGQRYVAVLASRGQRYVCVCGSVSGWLPEVSTVCVAVILVQS